MHKLPDLPYSYSALEPFIDEMTMKIHHDKHHQAYIDNLNAALVGQEKLASLSVEELLMGIAKVPEAIKTKVRNHGGGHANHTFFWKLMGSAKGEDDEPTTGPFAKAINDTFGSLKGFQEKFTAAGMGRFGSGWAWLVVANGKLEIVDLPNQDSPLMERKTPILGIDVWEHAYYLKYQNKRVDYIKAWWNVVNWSEVEKNFQAAVE